MQWIAEGSVFGAVSVFCFCVKYLGNRWMDLRQGAQYDTQDVFSPSLGRVWRSRSKVKVTRDKNGIFGLLAACVRFMFG